MSACFVICICMSSEQLKTDRRRIDLESELTLEQGQTLTVVKHVALYTERDFDWPSKEKREETTLLKSAVTSLHRAATAGYEASFSAHSAQWNALWQTIGVRIDGPDFDQLAVRFALFHLLQMTPRHDPRLSIAAKGLSGEGYKGHVFWDTEIFILPVFTFMMPEIASRLLGYRYHTVGEARRKAKENGYEGAMFAWERPAG